MADITMNLDDTLELDTIIKESSIANDPVTVSEGMEGSDYDIYGLETHTSIFNPKTADTTI